MAVENGSCSVWSFFCFRREIPTVLGLGGRLPPLKKSRFFGVSRSLFELRGRFLCSITGVSPPTCPGSQELQDSEARAGVPPLSPDFRVRHRDEGPPQEWLLAAT